MAIYRIDFEDNEREFLSANSDGEAYDEAQKLNSQHGAVDNIFQVNEFFHIIRCVM